MVARTCVFGEVMGEKKETEKEADKEENSPLALNPHQTPQTPKLNRSIFKSRPKRFQDLQPG